MSVTIAKHRGRFWSIALEWKAADAWVGAFWDRRGPLLNLWICLFPCLPIHVQHMRAGVGQPPEHGEQERKEK